jgi:predicted enzyme related to lactoylglutathione lyase
MTAGIQTIIYPVRDLTAAKERFQAILGEEPIVDQPYYVGWQISGQDIGLDPNGHSKGMAGPVAYCHVDDIAATVKALNAAGAQTLQDVTGVGGGKLIASLSDPDGNVIGLLQEESGS